MHFSPLRIVPSALCRQSVGPPAAPHSALLTVDAPYVGCGMTMGQRVAPTEPAAAVALIQRTRPLSASTATPRSAWMESMSTSHSCSTAALSIQALASRVSVSVLPAAPLAIGRPHRFGLESETLSRTSRSGVSRAKSTFASRAMKLDMAIAPSALVLTLVLTLPQASSCVAENDATPGGGGTWQEAAHFSWSQPLRQLRASGHERHSNCL